ncbi:MAG: hypothetical protein IJ272_03340 [Clostridia bacterium]|nr:hypothetical protein [Clostridia bacterium]
MNEEKNKKEKKPIPIKQILVIIAILALGFILSAAMFKMDLEEATSIEYTSTVNSQGQYVYTVKEEQSGYLKEVTTTEIAEDLEPTLGEYIRQSEEENVEAIKYLIEAESVTKLPYIDRESTDEEGLNGNIKFYRYIKETEDENEISGEDVKEENRLKFMKLEEFNAKLEAFKTNPEDNRDVYNYFTIDEEGTVLIAYGSEENRNIQTGFDGSLKDRDLSVDIINANSGESYTGNNDNGYSAARYEIFTKPVDYLSIVDQYVMPTNLLYSLLIHTGDIEFVTEIAKLAYDSELAIGIYDNKSYYEKNETYTYYKMLNLQVNTSLKFQNPIVSITDMGSPYIELTYEDIQNSPYSRIPISCESTTNNNGTIKHSETFTTGSHIYNPDDYNMYITGTDANNKITSLGTSDNGIFKTQYNQTINSMSTPTIAILVADTWISRWEATYTKTENTMGPYSAGELSVDETVNIQTYADKTGVLNEFASSFKTSVSTQLDNHALELRQNAIDKIIEDTPESTYTINASSISVSDSRRRQIFESHIAVCPDCVAIITSFGDSIGDRFQETVSSTGALHSTNVYNHYISALYSWRQQQATQKTAGRKEEFKSQLNQEGRISFTQTLSGSKDYKDITCNSTTKTRTTRYEKTNTESDRVKEKDGEKFSKIFNSYRFYDSREAIKKRSGQLWDYIRENEDTAKLEDILRYLLNIATKSEMFGEVEDIDEILKAFEPKELITISKLHGGSVEAKIWFALRSEGYSKEATAGVMGNLYKESTMIANQMENSYEGEYNDETYTEAVDTGQYSSERFINDAIGYGLAQWTYNTRKKGLYYYAQSCDVSIADEDMQIEYLIGEISESGGANGYATCQLYSRNGYTAEDWKNATTPESAADAFCWIFENPASDAADLTTRENKAKEYYEMYKNAEEGGYFVEESSGDVRLIGTFTSAVTGRTFTIYNQCKIDGWGRRCNRAAQISVCSGYYEGNPRGLIDEANAAPDMSMPRYQTMYDKYGLTYQNQTVQGSYTFDQNKIREQVLKGGYVILYVTGTDQGKDGVSKYGRDWAASAHWVAILGYRALDGKEEIFVSDSGHYNSGCVPLDEFEGITNSVIFIIEK